MYELFFLPYFVFFFLFLTLSSALLLCLSEGPYSRCPGYMCVCVCVCVCVLPSLLNWKQNKQEAVLMEIWLPLRSTMAACWGTESRYRAVDTAAIATVTPPPAASPDGIHLIIDLRSGSCCFCHHSDWPVLYPELGIFYRDLRKNS